VALIVVTGLFDESACIAAVTISLVGDGVAGVVKKFQSRNIASFSMFFFSIIALFCLRDYLSLFPSLVACLCATITERIEKVGRFYINDNLSVPVVAALIYSVVSATVG
jgi:dolichol kinase